MKPTKSQITINKQLNIRQIMDLFQIIKDYSGSITFQCETRTVEPERLSKLVSFMLTLKECNQLTIHISGNHTQYVLAKINNCCQPSQQHRETSYKIYLNNNRKLQS
ncbi:hypothetical protein [Bacillus cihuensis]|uniref:hypothetical protein n=1 Tax=Bacillus cihuensis TaxID=1208599 RepID=UPI00048BFD7C|nr:hypothetical protein [Bacillus cihuensis]